MKRMLFNATQAEELRVAIIDENKLVDLDIESTGKEQKKSNIYKAVVTRIEPSLEAVFVNYGADRHGFLPFKEISRASLPQKPQGRFRVQDALSEGQELLIQVDKEERGNKGAALTTFISLAGRYIVLMPNNPRGGGISRRIEGEERNELRDVLDQIQYPDGMSIIARTAGIGRSLPELQWDVDYLLQLWNAIDTAAKEQAGPFLIYQESSLVIRAVRDYFRQDIEEILIDTQSIYEQVKQFISHVMPQNVALVKLYNEETPLFSKFKLEHQIETAYSRQVTLPSGGAIVIDHTEALVSVDVNSARSTRGSDIEQTAITTNLEAADEVARQLRLRDLGGLIVIDFIDMENPKNQRDVENRLKDALKTDRARIQLGKISRFGLLELSRQRLQPSLGESSNLPCDRCHGTGHIRGTESSALHILRVIQEEANRDDADIIEAQVPVNVATYLLNEKRAQIHAIETRLKTDVLIIPNPHLQTPNYKIARRNNDHRRSEDLELASYQRVEIPDETAPQVRKTEESKVLKQEALVKGITPSQPAPMPLEEKASSIFGRIMSWFSGDKVEEKQKPIARTHTQRFPSNQNRNTRGRNNNSRRRNTNGTYATREEIPKVDSQEEITKLEPVLNTSIAPVISPSLIASTDVIAEKNTAENVTDIAKVSRPRNPRRNNNNRRGPRASSTDVNAESGVGNINTSSNTSSVNTNATPMVANSTPTTAQPSYRNEPMRNEPTEKVAAVNATSIANVQAKSEPVKRVQAEFKLENVDLKGLKLVETSALAKHFTTPISNDSSTQNNGPRRPRRNSNPRPESQPLQQVETQNKSVSEAH